MPAEKLLRRSIAALACAAALAAAARPAFAMTLAQPALPQSGPQAEKVWYGWGWGWGAAAVVGGLVAGTAIGAAAAAASTPYYYGPAYYGPGPYYAPPPACLRRWVDYYGYPHWRRVC